MCDSGEPWKGHDLGRQISMGDFGKRCSINVCKRVLGAKCARVLYCIDDGCVRKGAKLNFDAFLMNWYQLNNCNSGSLLSPFRYSIQTPNRVQYL